jgi:pimeloyl-ACP methyl ester carboxylesterase
MALAGGTLRTSVRSVGSSRGRLLRVLSLVVCAVVVGLAVVYWSWVDAQARAVVVISSVLEAPVLTPVVEGVSGEPRFEDVRVAGNPAWVVEPTGEGPWPALFFVNGTVPQGRELPEVRRLAEGFARAGYLVVVPDLPGLREDEITPRTVSETLQVARAVSEWPDAQDGEVALIGVSTGATLALLAAEGSAMRGRISVVAGIAPYSDIRTVLNIATTGHYREADGEFARYEADPFLSYVVARSLIAALPPGEDRSTLSDELEEVDRQDPDPLAGLRERRLGDLGPEARSVVKLLGNEDPERFDDLYAALPDGVRDSLEQFSPLAGTERLHAPVEIASGPRDRYFPASESYALERIAPQRRVTVTDALDHAELSFSIQDLPAFARFDGFVVRSLREARLEDSDAAG